MIAFVFPGQGSQTVGMGRALAEAFPICRETFEEADAALGFALGATIFEGPADRLTLTEITQPAILTVSVAAWRLLESRGCRPAIVAGHSLGEYSAHVAAGTFSFADAVRTVHHRGRYMQEAVPVGTGAMAAILGMEAAKVIAGCAEAQATFGAGSAEVVEAVNFNDAAQTVIAGSKAAVEKACEVLKANGAKRALPLPVSAPFHSSLMKPAADKLKVKLADTLFAAAQIPLVNNIDVAVETDADRIRDALYRQAFGPVRWVECVQAIKARGISTLVECGPGKVLAGMTKRIDAELTGAALFDPATLADVKELLA